MIFHLRKRRPESADRKNLEACVEILLAYDVPIREGTPLVKLIDKTLVTIGWNACKPNRWA
jgi:hypothetical protein